MSDQMLRVHLLRTPDSGPLDYLRELIDDEVVLTTGEELPDPPDYHIFIAGRPRREHIAEASQLQTLIIPWAGLPRDTRELMLDFPDVAVHNLHHNAAPVAELAVGLLLAAAKFLIPMDRALRAHDWTPRYQPNPSLLLAEKTALVLGYGEIGQRVAEICRGMRMKVLATRRNVEETPPDCPDEIHSPEALLDLLPRAHAVIICLPLTDETKGLIDAEALARMPSGAVLVNIGRGPIVRQEALYHALRTGGLRAAGLDVWYNYPQDEASRSNTPPADVPFHTLDNVVMSPHRGGALSESETECMRMEALARLINAAARGESMLNPVDVERGY